MKPVPKVASGPNGVHGEGRNRSFRRVLKIEVDEVDVVLSKSEGVVSPVELDVTKGLLCKDSDLVARKSLHCPPFAFKTGCAEFSENRIQAGSF